jgi:hypothetical protein
MTGPETMVPAIPGWWKVFGTVGDVAASMGEGFRNPWRRFLGIGGGSSIGNGG